MTNYTITQSSKGGRKRAQLSAQHDNAIIHRLLTDGYATQETSNIIARELKAVKVALKEWNNSPAIIERLDEMSAKEAVEMADSADWLHENARIDRMSDWYDEGKTAMMLSAARWALVMHSVVRVVVTLEALRNSSYQRYSNNEVKS
jgi:hypothetical protein